MNQAIRGRNEENNSVLAGVLYCDPPASDLLALHALSFPLSLPFGRLATQAKVDKALNGRDSNLFCRDTSSIRDVYLKKMLMELGSGNRFFRQVIVT